jgi:hypothetical protein
VKCPHCGENTPELWQDFAIFTDWKGAALEKPVRFLSMEPGDSRFIGANLYINWMVCPNEICKQIIIKIHRILNPRRGEIFTPGFRFEEQWFAVPRKPFPRPLDPLVLDPYRRDYLEAALILDDSPRMSAILARKIVADLLESYGQVKRSLKLSKMMDEFIESGRHPSHVTENLHYLREVADFSAHTQKDELGNIVEVNLGEAEWTLEVVDTLFDYFIIGPEKDKRRRANIDKKIEAAGRKPINSPKI